MWFEQPGLPSGCGVNIQTRKCAIVTISPRVQGQYLSVCVRAVCDVRVSLLWPEQGFISRLTWGDSDQSQGTEPHTYGRYPIQWVARHRSQPRLAPP